MRNNHFQALHFRTDYKVCGEDVELSLDLRERLGLNIVFCPSFSGVHASEATRSQTEGQDGNSEDMSRMRIRRKQFLDQATSQQLSDELFVEALQAEVLRSVELERQRGERQLLQASTPKQQLLQQIKQLQEELASWQEKCHSLHLTRLRLQQSLKQQRQDTSATL